MSERGKMRVLEGLSDGPGKNQYQPNSTKNELVIFKEWKPSSGSDLDRDAVIQFSFKTGPRELVRFHEDPFYLKFKCNYANPDKKAPGCQNVTAEMAAPTHNVRAQDMLPGIYLDPLLEGRALFSKIEVLVNGVKVGEQNLDEFGHIYHAVNRIFTSQSHCKKKYGKEIPRISTSKERDATTVDSMSAALKQACKSLSFQTWRTATPNLVRFGADGLWPFSSQCNMLQVLLGRTVPNGFLRPQTQLDVRFHKRQPLHAMVDTATISDDVYFNAESQVPDDTVKSTWKDLAFQLVDLTIVYESFTPEPSQLLSLTTGTLRYFCDVPTFKMAAVTPGQQWLQQVCQVPKWSKLVIIGWAHASQLWYEANSHKNLHTRFKFLPNAVNLTMRSSTRAAIGFEGGYEKIGTSDAHTTNWAMVYHSELVRRGIFSEEFAKMFPGDAATSYRQLLLVDLTPYDIPDDFELTLTTTFNAELSPKNFFMWHISVQQHQYSQGLDGKITTEVVGG